ncbi:unnamed protein product [Phytophthora fragariaefolia]|uniref:Unnamed protein product n=1 Tax=Phytophthora fragariaefolia TaxID=1490495 RepID=A0A9W6XFB2_9STRA|nr:unnamed protein product [Phytophthora fragariaefolia]
MENAVEQRLPHVQYAAEQRLPHENNAVEQGLPFADDSVAQETLRDTGMAKTKVPCLEEDEVSSSETSASSRCSRRLRKSKRNRSGRRRLRRRPTAADQAPSSKSVNVVEYSDDFPNRIRTVEVANPPSDAGEIEQVCLLTGSDQPAVLANVVSDDASSSRPKAAEPKSVREARFAAQSWAALQDSNNPVYSLAREFEDIFPEKIPAELPAERGVRDEINLVPGAKYWVTRQWLLPRDQVQPIDEFSKGRQDLVDLFLTAPKNQTEIRQWLGLANYLNKYTRDYAGLIQPMSSLLKKDVAWDWRPKHQDTFDAVKKSLASAPVLMLPDTSRPFHVVCDASDFAIGCALMQFDAEGRERVVSYQSRQMKPAEKNYPVHDKGLLAMRYALIKFRVYLLGEQTFAVYTDHAPLRTAMKIPHLSQRMARWLSFFAEYNFVVHYKPGKNNILADALSRRPDYDRRRLTRHHDIPGDDDDEDCCATCVTLGINATVSSPVLPLPQQIADAYEEGAFYAAFIRYLRNSTADTHAKLTRHTRDTITRYDLDCSGLT